MIHNLSPEFRDSMPEDDVHNPHVYWQWTFGQNLLHRMFGFIFLQCPGFLSLQFLDDASTENLNNRKLFDIITSRLYHL